MASRSARSAIMAIDSRVPGIVPNIPGYGGQSSGGLLLLLVGAYLLLAFVTGRLAWLTNAISDTFALHDQAVAAPPASSVVAPSTPGLPPSQVAVRRPRSAPTGMPVWVS
jgi:hypothetical protein